MESSQSSDGAKVLITRAIIRLILWVLTLGVVGTVAVILYSTFYFAYIPNVSLTKPVYLLFRSDCDNLSTGLCSFPSANVSLLHEQRQERILMRGQPYKILLTLEMPNSPANQRLGMFMIRADFLTDSGHVITSSSRSCMLPYQSWLVQYLRTLVYSLPLAFGWSEEKQSVSVPLFERYMDNTYRPAAVVSIFVMSRQIEIYSASLSFEATFSGIRYIMYNWPLTSATVAIGFNVVAMFFIISLAFKKGVAEERGDEGVDEGTSAGPFDTSPSDESLTSALSQEGVVSGETVQGTSSQPVPKGASGRVRLSPLKRRAVRKRVVGQRVTSVPGSRAWLRCRTFTPYRSGDSSGGNLEPCLLVEGDGSMDGWGGISPVSTQLEEAKSCNTWETGSAGGSTEHSIHQPTLMGGHAIHSEFHSSNTFCPCSENSEGSTKSSNQDILEQQREALNNHKVFSLRQTKSEGCLADLKYEDRPNQARSCTLFKLFSLFSAIRDREQEPLTEEVSSKAIKDKQSCLLAGTLHKSCTRSEENLGTDSCFSWNCPHHVGCSDLRKFSTGEQRKEAKTEGYQDGSEAEHRHRVTRNRFSY